MSTTGQAADPARQPEAPADVTLAIELADGPAERVPEAGVGAAMIRAERLRQVAIEGYDEKHDAHHSGGDLIRAAVAYATAAVGATGEHTAAWWPFDLASFKPGPEPLGSLVKAGALIAAGIDRIVAEEAGVSEHQPEAPAVPGDLTRSERDLVMADLGQLLEILGLGNYARPESPHEVMQQCIAAAARLKPGAAMLGRIVTGHVRAMEAARIEMLQNGPQAAMQWILNSRPDLWDDPETAWDGRESAVEWFDRTESFCRAESAVAGSASDDTSRALPAVPESAQERSGATLGEAAERNRADAAEAKLAAVTAELKAVMAGFFTHYGNSTAPSLLLARDLAEAIRQILDRDKGGTGEEAGHA